MSELKDSSDDIKEVVTDKSLLVKLQPEQTEISHELEIFSETESASEPRKENFITDLTEKDPQSMEQLSSLTSIEDPLIQEQEDYLRENIKTVQTVARESEDNASDSKFSTISPESYRPTTKNEDDYDYLSKIIGLPTKSSESNELDSESSEESEEVSTTEITDTNPVKEILDFPQSTFTSDFLGLDSVSNFSRWEVDEMDSVTKIDPFKDDNPFNDFQSGSNLDEAGNFCRKKVIEMYFFEIFPKYVYRLDKSFYLKDQ